MQAETRAVLNTFVLAPEQTVEDVRGAHTGISPFSTEKAATNVPCRTPPQYVNQPLRLSSFTGRRISSEKPKSNCGADLPGQTNSVA